MLELRSLCLQAVLGGEPFGLAHYKSPVSREPVPFRWLYRLLPNVSNFDFP
jgi:hypothetical protein